jgi:DNA-binding MarR family transcriptional regulator
MASSPQEIENQLHRFGLASLQMRAALAHVVGVSETDLDALEHIEADGPLTQRELGERLSLTSGAVTMLVDRLERGGWLRRRPHPTDRRAVLLELTEQTSEQSPPPLAAYHDSLRALSSSLGKHGEAVAAFLAAAADAAGNAADELRRLRREAGEGNSGSPRAR